MSLLPIVERELRVRARLASTRWVRVVAGGVATLFALWGLLNPAYRAAGQGGKLIFQSLNWMVFLFVLLEGARQTYDALSAERREGTLGLLFLTDLRGYDVVLGKLASAGLGSLYGVLAVVPALAVTVLAGGVTGGEIWRSSLAWFGALFLASAVGLWVSARSEDENRALFASLGIVGLLAVLPILGGFLVQGRAFSPSQGGIALLSPATPFVLADETAYRTSAARAYWQSLGVMITGGTLLLGAAAWRLGRHWRAAEPADSTRAAGRQNRRARMQDQDPVFWLAAEQAGARRMAWTACAVMLAASLTPVWMVLLNRLGNANLSAMIALSLGSALLNFTGALLVAWVACRPMIEARGSGLLELMLTTPYPSATFIRQQWRAARRVLTGPVVCLALIQCLLFLLAEWSQRGLTSRVSFGGMAGVLIRPIQVLLHLGALVWVALWLGASLRKPAQAPIKALVYVSILPMILLRVLPVHLLFNWIIPFTPGLYYLWYTAVPTLIDVAWWRWARRRLFTRFRRVVTRDAGATEDAPGREYGLTGLIHRLRTWQTD